jgi:hypothetical protein
MGEVLLDEDQVLDVCFVYPFANLISELLSLFTPCLSFRELAIQDQAEAKTAETDCEMQA